MKSKKKQREPYVSSVPKDVWTLPDGRHMAFHTGFEKKGDAVWPAPSHSEPMNAIRLERIALQEFINALQEHVHQQMRKIVAREDEWWSSVESDLGIKRGEASYFYNEGCFRKQPVDNEKKP